MPTYGADKTISDLNIDESAVQPDIVYKFTNCFLLRNHEIVKDDLWVRKGKIVDPEILFFCEKKCADEVFDCCGCLIAPGFVDLQINGGFGQDFTYAGEKIADAVSKVAKNILAHGVTSFCPTIVSSLPQTYKVLLSRIRKRPGGIIGAGILGVHLEGPFINPIKKGAHDEQSISDLPEGFKTVQNTYGPMVNVSLVTLAPEIPRALEVIEKLTLQRIVVSLGHSNATMDICEKAVARGATCITHLFNAMEFHHRDPGILGLISSRISSHVYFGMICDGTHTHPAAIRLAYNANPDHCFIVTDAISALGLAEGTHCLGRLTVDIKDGKAFVAGTDTLCGSMTPFIDSIKIFQDAADCSLASALEAGSLRPAEVLQLQKHKGTLDYNADADFIMLNEDLKLLQTWIAGKLVYKNEAIANYLFRPRERVHSFNPDLGSSESLERNIDTLL